MAPGELRVTRGSFISWPQKTADRRQKTLSLSLSLFLSPLRLESAYLSYVHREEHSWSRVGEASGGRSVCLSVCLSVFDVALKARAGKKMEGVTRWDAGAGIGRNRGRLRNEKETCKRRRFRETDKKERVACC